MKLSFILLVILNLVFVSCDLFDDSNDDGGTEVQASASQGKIDNAAADAQEVSKELDELLKDDSQCESNECQEAQEDYEKAVEQLNKEVENGTFIERLERSKRHPIEDITDTSITLVGEVECDEDFEEYTFQSITYDYEIKNDTLYFSESGTCDIERYVGNGSKLIGTWELVYEVYSYSQSSVNGGEISCQIDSDSNTPKISTGRETKRLIITEDDIVKQRFYDYNCYFNVQWDDADEAQEKGVEKISCNEWNIEYEHGLNLTFEIENKSETFTMAKTYEFDGNSCSYSSPQKYKEESTRPGCSAEKKNREEMKECQSTVIFDYCMSLSEDDMSDEGVCNKYI